MIISQENRDITMNEYNHKYSFYMIANEITKSLGKVLATRPYIGIVDILGNIYYLSIDLNEHINLIQKFIENISDMLDIGDHSIPFSSKINIGFFRISQKAIIIIYTKKGTSGQLLAFKAQMFEWSNEIDALMVNEQKDLDVKIMYKILKREENI